MASLILLLAALVIAGRAEGAAAIVQSAAYMPVNTDESASSPRALAYPSNTAAGNYSIVRGFCYRFGAVASCTVSDSQTNSYTIVASATTSQGSGNYYVFLACASLQAGANSVSVTLTGSSIRSTFVITEVSGITGCTADASPGLTNGGPSTAPSASITTV